MARKPSPFQVTGFPRYAFKRSRRSRPGTAGGAIGGTAAPSRWMAIWRSSLAAPQPAAKTNARMGRPTQMTVSPIPSDSPTVRKTK